MLAIRIAIIEKEFMDTIQMKNSLKQENHKKSDREKSIKEVMDNAYKVAENSGFYIPFRKYDWYGFKGTQDHLD